MAVPPRSGVALVQSIHDLAKSVQLSCSELLDIQTGSELDLFRSSQFTSIRQNLAVFVHNMRLAHNLIRPVNRLLPQTLAEIFRLVRDDHHLSDECYGWLYVTQVCRHWRQVALSSPHLWTKISTAHPEYVSLFLSRSDSAPLSVSIARQLPLSVPRKHAHLTSIRRIGPHTARIRSIKMGPVDEDLTSDSKDIIELLHHPAPILETLSVTFYHFQTTPPHIFDGRTPELRRLSMTALTMWPRNKFENLTELCILDPPALITFFPGFLDTLRSSPFMQRLILRESRLYRPREVGIDPPQDADIIQLNQLQRIHLDNFPVFVGSLLPRLVLPATAAVYLRYPRMRIPTDLARNLSSSSSSATGGIKKLLVSWDEDATKITGAGPTSSTFHISSHSGIAASVEFLVELMSHNDITELCLEQRVDSGAQASPLSSTFTIHRLPSVQALFIRTLGCSPSPLISCLSSSSTGPLPCPNLNALDIFTDHEFSSSEEALISAIRERGNVLWRLGLATRGTTKLRTNFLAKLAEMVGELNYKIGVDEPVGMELPDVYLELQNEENFWPAWA